MLPMPELESILSHERNLIFRITHVRNLPWILEHGVHCRASEVRDPEFINIGNPELIERRRSRHVPIPPGGTLEEYVAFYFTPHSPMLLNIKTGYGNIPQRKSAEIAIVVSSLKQLETVGVPYVFTDRHAYLQTAEFYSSRDDLHAVDFALLRQGNFARDPEDPGKMERYQAEALAYGCVPVEALVGIACYTDSIKQEIDTLAKDLTVGLKVFARPGWYF